MARNSKYNAQRVEIEKEKFHSKREARTYQTLKAWAQTGGISNLQRQVKFPIRVNGMLICNYYADFVYTDGWGRQVVADAKGYPTDVYKLKRKLLKACYGIDIIEL